MNTTPQFNPLVSEESLSTENIGKIKRGKPVIWLYWENKNGEKTPSIIDFCHETIKINNYKDFLIIITNPSNIHFYLPNLGTDYLLLEQIAHRADYIRFNLLYEYGGIWLDSDFISFKSLKPVLEKIDKYDFVYTGYKTDENKIFPMIAFLGSKPKNIIAGEMINKIDTIIKQKVKKNLQPNWDEVGGHSLQQLLTDINSYRYKTKLFSQIDIHSHEQKKLLLPIKLKKSFLKNSFGQMLCYSMHSGFYDFIGKDILNMECFISSALRKNLPIIMKSRIPRIINNAVFTNDLAEKISKNYPQLYKLIPTNCFKLLEYCQIKLRPFVKKFGKII